MPRQARQASGTGIYHVMMRGINHQYIFEEQEDYYLFLNTLDLMAQSYKPDGTMRKLIDVSKLHSLGWTHKVEIEEGVAKLFEWYKESLE